MSAQTTRRSKLAANVTVRQHGLLSDVLAELGGEDQGPNPHELLEAALAACTTITVQMYANRKEMKLESADVSVKIESEGSQGAVISRKIKFKGDLSDDEKMRLLEIANRCPIHKLLALQISISTEMMPAL